MEEECGGTIAMEHGSYGYIPAGRLAVTRRSKYRSTFSCHVTIVAPEPERLIIVFRELDIELEPNCDDDFVQFFDGRTRSAPIVRGKYFLAQIPHVLLQVLRYVLSKSLPWSKAGPFLFRYNF